MLGISRSFLSCVVLFFLGYRSRILGAMESSATWKRVGAIASTLVKPNEGVGVERLVNSENLGGKDSGVRDPPMSMGGEERNSVCVDRDMGSGSLAEFTPVKGAMVGVESVSVVGSQDLVAKKRKGKEQMEMKEMGITGVSSDNRMTKLGLSEIPLDLGENEGVRAKKGEDLCQVVDIERLNVLKAYLLGVNREDLIPVARPEHPVGSQSTKWSDIGKLGEKPSAQKDGRFGDIQDSLKLAKGRGLGEGGKFGGYTIQSPWFISCSR